MTQLTALHAKISGDSSAYTQAVNAAIAAGERLKKAATALGARFKSLGDSSFFAGGQMRQLSMQLSQVAQMATVTGQPLRALAVQLPDIGLAFGTIGIAAGAVAGVALPAVIAAFSNAEEEANSFKEALSALQEQTRDTELELKQLRLGLDNIKQAAAAEEIEGALHALAELNAELIFYLDQVRGPVNLSVFADQINSLYEQIAAQEEIISNAQKALEADQSVTSELERTTEEAKAFADVLERIPGLLDDIDAAAKSVADRMAETRHMLRFAGEEAAMGVSLDPVKLPPGIKGATSGGARGGGGARVDTMQRDIDQLKEELATELEAEMEHFAARQELLQQALEQEYITRLEYQELMERARQEHQDNLERIDAMAYGGILAQTEGFLGAMATAFSAGGEKMLRVSKAFAAAEAWVSTLRGAAKELEKGTFGFASAAAVIARGAALVSAIKGVGSGGGGGGVGGVSGVSAAPPQLVQDVTISIPAGAQFDLAQAIIEQIGNRISNGAQIRGLTVARG